MTTRWRRLPAAVLAAGLVAGGCAGAGDDPARADVDDDTARAGAGDAATEPDAGDPSAADAGDGSSERGVVDGEKEPPPGARIVVADSCDALHAAVLTELDQVRTRADDALTGTSLEELITDVLAQGQQLPPEVAFLESLAPGRPYGGVAGAAAEARYADLGCTPDDEYPAVAGHLDVPVDATDARLQAALDVGEATAGDAVTLGLVRRLLEGAATGDDAAVLVTAMEEAVAAQEAVRAATGAYTEDVGDLVATGLPAEYDDVEGVFLLVLAADADRYCMTVAGDRGVAYVESHDAVPVVESRPDPADWCAATFGELD
jgi:hypothetical protein